MCSSRIIATFAASAMIRTFHFFQKEQDTGPLVESPHIPHSGNSPCMTVHSTVKSIADFPAGVGSTFLSKPYFQALEEGGPENVIYRYVSVHEGKEMVGVFHFQLIPINRKSLLSRIRDRPYHRLFAAMSKLLDLLLCSNLVSSRKNALLVFGNACISGPYGMICTKDNELVLSSFLPDALSLMKRSAGPAFRIVGIVSKDYPEGQNPHRKMLGHRRFMRLFMDPIMHMDIRPDWTNLQDYAQDLSSKYRMRFNKALKKIEYCEWKELDEEWMRRERITIDNLYQQVQENAPLRLVDHSAFYLIALKKNLKGKLRFLALYENGQMLAFVTAIRNGDELEAHHIGFEYALNKSHSLYLNILYAYIDIAIGMRCRSLCFGRTAMEIKSTVGAVPQDYETHLRLENPVLNNWVKWMLPDKQGRMDWIQRNPYR